MPAITPNPAGTAIICQSLDNQVGVGTHHSLRPGPLLLCWVPVCARGRAQACLCLGAGCVGHKLRLSGCHAPALKYMRHHPRHPRPASFCPGCCRSLAAHCASRAVCVIDCCVMLCCVACCVSQIVTYLTKDRFKQNRKKTFKGHNTAGYACQVNFSPDAKYVLSGECWRLETATGVCVARLCNKGGLGGGRQCSSGRNSPGACSCGLTSSLCRHCVISSSRRALSQAWHLSSC
jgi:hypothetical protein